MKPCRVQDIKPGMILQKEVRDSQDRVLIPDGASLTEKHRELLIARGVEEVHVRDTEEAPPAKTEEDAGVEVPSPDSDSPTPEELARRKELMLRIQHMFEGTLSDPVMKQIFTLSMKRAHAGALHE